MKLDDTKKLLSYPCEGANPRTLLVDVLRASIELVSLEDNDFAWSSWADSAAAVAELSRLLEVAETGGTLDRLTLSVIFAPTGPMQEVSISSGWGETFLKVAERYDYAEKGIWGKG
jgi:hypothetical protein